MPAGNERSGSYFRLCTKFIAALLSPSDDNLELDATAQFGEELTYLLVAANSATRLLSPFDVKLEAARRDVHD